MADRTPRDVETRDVESRTRGWQRPSTLPTPKPRDGVKYRWIRTSTLGAEDIKNVSSRFREGYVPVKAKDHPEMMMLPDLDSRFAKEGNIEVGGLMLCSIDSSVSDGRIQYQQEMTRRQMESVDNVYLRENDPRMPLLPTERSSRTTFGR